MFVSGIQNNDGMIGLGMKGNNTIIMLGVFVLEPQFFLILIVKLKQI